MRGGWDNKAGRTPGRVVCSNTDGLETVILSEGSQVKRGIQKRNRVPDLENELTVASREG